MKKLLYTTAVAAALFATHPASAAEGSDALAAERFQLRGRVIGVLPAEDSSVSIGGDVDVGNAYVPEFDISYYFTDHVSAELILATARHKLEYTGGVDLGKTWILPPTLTMQYHFTPDSAFSPYVGAGLNYSMFYGEDEAAGMHNLDVQGGVGYALQAGYDYWLDDHWGLNMDVKKLWLNIDAKLDVGATPVRADIDLDPWIVGLGVSYRF